MTESFDLAARSSNTPVGLAPLVEEIIIVNCIFQLTNTRNSKKATMTSMRGRTVPIVIGATTLLNKLCLPSSPRKRGSREASKAQDSRIRRNDDGVYGASFHNPKRVAIVLAVQINSELVIRNLRCRRNLQTALGKCLQRVILQTAPAKSG